MTHYRLVFDELDTARIRPVDASSAAPLAWFRLVWVEDSNDIAAVHVYGHHELISQRSWLATRAAIPDAVAFCDTLPRVEGTGDYDWSEGAT